MSLRSRIVVRRAGFTLDVALEVADGDVVVLLGPNGAGKTTVLRALAGLLPLSGGFVELDGDVLEDAGGLVETGRTGVTTADHDHIPARRRRAEDRPVGVVFQDYRLFPHLSALENVAFGPRARGVGRREARERAAAVLDRMGLADHCGAKPTALSGGQAQRVALARALAVEPRLLLLDEPLAALDAATRLEVRASLTRHLADFAGATVLVTHDPLDAMVLANRIVVLEGGSVVQEGAPGEMARRPRTAYVARLVGLNLWRGVAQGPRVSLDGGGEVVAADPASGPGGVPAGRQVLVAVRPDAVALYRSRPDGSPRNVWHGVVRGVEMHGHHVRVDVDGSPAVLADVTPGAVADLGLAPGVTVWAAVKASEVTAYAAGLDR